MTLLNRADKAVETCCKVLLAVLFFLMIASAFIQVATRMVGHPQTWTEELCRYCMVWLTMVGSGLAVKTHGHIAVDILKGAISRKTAARIDMFNLILEIIFSLILIVFGFALCMRNMSQITPGLKLPMGIPYFSMPVGGGIILFNAVVHLIKHFVNREEVV